MHVSFEELSPQKQIVTCDGGLLLVLAGPGTQKIMFLNHRVAYLITRKVSPKEILAITFTKKSVNEMLERLRNFKDLGAAQLHVSTLHAESPSILGELGVESFEFIADDETPRSMQAGLRGSG